MAGGTVSSGSGSSLQRHDKVYVDPESDFSGTGRFVGTPERPVNNIDDAIDICEMRDIGTIIILQGEVVPSDDKDIRGLNIIGATLSFIDLNGVTYNTNTYLENLVVTGDAGGYPDIEEPGDIFLLCNQCVIAWFAPLYGFEFLAAFNSIVHNYGITGDEEKDRTGVELWNCVSDNRMASGEENYTQITAGGVQMVNCSGEFYIELEADVLHNTIVMNGGIIHFDKNSNENATVMVYGNCEIVDDAKLDLVDNTIQSKMEEIKLDVADVIIGEVEDTSTYTDDGGEQNIIEVSLAELTEINNIKLDLSELTQDGTWRIYADDILVREEDWIEEEDSETIFISVDLIMDETIKLTWEEDEAEGEDREIAYNLRYRGVGE